MKKSVYTLLTLFLMLTTAVLVNAGEGTTNIKTGYIYTDETGNSSVNQETYNIYDGFNLSITDFSYTTNNGILFNADFLNTTLDNRNLRLSSSKPGLFSLSAYNNKYRRNYNYENSYNTTRNSYGFRSSLIAAKNVRFFGGYYVTDKSGTTLQQIDIMNDTSLFLTDYRQTAYKFGVQGFSSLGNLRVEYRKSDFDDKTANPIDRESNQLTISAFSKIPKQINIHLSGGYIYRTDKETTYNSETKTNQLWGGAKYYFLKNNSIEYRIRFARTDNSSNSVETDNWINNITFGKTWKGSGGIRIGFESRIVDDLVDRSESNGLIVDGWYKTGTHLLFRGIASTRSKDIPTGSTLLGDESITRHLFSVRYRDNNYGDLTLRLDKRIRKNDDVSVNTQIDYTSISSILNLKDKNYGSVNIIYSYYLGEFENRDLVSETFKSYEFSDHVVTGTMTPNSYGNFDISFGGTYYRSRRDQDKEKFSFNIVTRYHFPHDHTIELKYDVFNYDDYQLNRNYYTANIVEINFIKAIKL